jgi:hypothetical protein
MNKIILIGLVVFFISGCEKNKEVGDALHNDEIINTEKKPEKNIISEMKNKEKKSTFDTFMDSSKEKAW